MFRIICIFAFKSLQDTNTMKAIGTILTVVLMTLALASCEKSLEKAGATEGNSVLTVMTRSGENDAKVSYPVTIYVMNEDGQCVRRLQLTSANDQLSMKLQPMTYHIYAVAGATDGDYTLPGQDDATATSEIALNEDAVHGDLMTASNTVTMSEEENTVLTLTMVRKVMQIESLVINQVPKSVDAVTVTLAPIYDNLLLNGNYSATTSTQTVTLTEQADGTTWQNDEALYMLPSNGNATITVKFSRGGTITSYAYSSPLPLEANKHIRITGTFTGTDELTLSGTITGATWDGTTTIEFTFDETGSTTTGGGTSGGGDNGGNSGGGDESDVVEGPVPTVGSYYQNCSYVLDSTNDGDYVMVTLVHKDEANIIGSGKSIAELEDEIEDALSSFEINGITGWRLPTEAEMSQFTKAMFSGLSGATPLTTNTYYYQAINGIYSALVSDMGIGLERPYSSGEKLRPVTTLKFHKE